MSSWASAFRAAKATEAEGRAAFADVLDAAPKAGKRSRDGDDEAEGEGEEVGCFRQPAGLSQFYKRLKSGEPPPIAAVSSRSEEGASERPSKQQLTEGGGDYLARQICRSWLKHTYLGLGSACGDKSCGRSHKPPAVVAHMYKDFSFKGLSKENRAKIITKMEAEKKST